MPSTVTVGVLSGLLLLVVVAGIATASPAAAVDDPTRPDARVTHGPSCRPGGLVVEVVGGSVPYVVRLATARQPGGEDQANVAPGTTVVLRTDDVTWGETIDGRLEFASRDGSGTTFVDELENYSFTRPTQEDCAAVDDPTQPHPSPLSSSGEPRETQAGAPPGLPPHSASASSDSVAPGDTVTVRGAGFLPGERVVVQLRGGAVLATTSAVADGSVIAQIRIPEGTEVGPTTVDLVGDDSAVVADIDLRVAALPFPAGEEDDVAALVPLIVAAGALVATAAGYLSVANRQWAAPYRRRPLSGSA